MSFLDLDEMLIELADRVELVYGPLVDTKTFPENVDLTLVEGAVTNVENLVMARTIRTHSRLVVSFGDCAVTGNVTSMRNRIPVRDLLTAVYQQARAPIGAEALKDLPALLKQALPLHQAINVDVYLPGCPPAPERIAAALIALLAGHPVNLPAEMLTFG